MPSFAHKYKHMWENKPKLPGKPYTQSVSLPVLSIQEIRRRAHHRQKSEIKRMTCRAILERPRTWTHHVCSLLANARLIENRKELESDEYRNNILDRFQLALRSFVGVQTDAISKEETVESFSRVPIICVDGDKIMMLQTGMKLRIKQPMFNMYDNIPRDTTSSQKSQFEAAMSGLMEVNDRIRARHRVVYTNDLMFAVGGYPEHMGPPKALASSASSTHTQVSPDTRPVVYQIGIIQTAAPSFEAHFLDRGLLVSDQPFDVRAPEPVDSNYDTSIPYVAFAEVFGDTIPWRCEDYDESLHADNPAATIHIKYFAYFWTMVDQMSNILQTANAAMAPGAMRRPRWHKMGLRGDLEIVQPRQDAPGVLRMSAIGSGFFARWTQNGFEFNVSRFVQIMLVNALKCALILTPSPHSDKYSTNKYPAAPNYAHISRIELCNFDVFSADKLWDMWDFKKFHRSCNKHIDIVTLDGQDLLNFTPEQIHNNRCVIVNAGDVFSLPGNEFGYGSVDAMVGNNTTLRITQSYLTNQTLLAHEGTHFHETISPLAQYLECVRKARQSVAGQEAYAEFLKDMYDWITHSVKKG